MPVLDYPRWTGPATDGLSIVVPPFHTGGLGLVPKPELRLALHLPHTHSSHGELLAAIQVTPFHSEHHKMFRLQCILHDRPGVVGTLLEAISHHNVNIIKQDSCQINAGNHHYVGLILDWTHAVEV